MRRATAILLAAALIGAADAALAATLFERKKKHEAMQAAIRASRAEQADTAAENAAEQADPDDGEDKKQRRTFNEWLEAFKDRNYIELDIDE